MVGRLVKDQQIRLFEQQAGQQRARLLPAAQLANRREEVVDAKTEAGQRLLDAQP
ncbi:MAG: hypothetical protein HND48_02095 [Chloroflexi bacterium]|nr:hypothetical protein [Chloroflexota bacterium]